MAGSETAGGVVMTSREPFTLGGGGVKHNNNNNNNNSSSSTTSPHPMLHHSHPQPVIHNIRLAYSPDGTAVYKPLPASATSPPYHSDNSAAGGGGGGANTTGVPLPHDNLNIKRKRGRPRKYGVVDASMALALSSPHPAAAAAVTQPAVTFSPPPPPPPPSSATTTITTTTTSEGSALPTTSSLKKGRGRPPGSSKKQQMEALGSAGVGFTPHIISVKAGEDVSSKIMSFSQIGPRAVCVLSANGTISNVTLRQAATSGGTATYEGRFDILSLSGSFMLTEVGGQRSRTGGLSVSLAGPDGRVLGGCVAGLLTAASPVQVIVGSFIADGRKETKAVNQTEPLYVPHNLISAGGGGGGMSTGGSSPPSRGTLSGSSGGPGSPLNQSTGAYNNNSNSNVQGMSSMPWK